MLDDAQIMATIAVTDMAAGKQFYGETMGLKQVGETMGGITYQSGAGKLFMYEAPTGGTSQATTATWQVGDVAAAAEGLAGKGVVFEHYDVPNAVWEGDVMVMGDTKAAWFKDPSGNILCLAGG